MVLPQSDRPNPVVPVVKLLQNRRCHVRVIDPDRRSATDDPEATQHARPAPHDFRFLEECPTVPVQGPELDDRPLPGAEHGIQPLFDFPEADCVSGRILSQPERHARGRVGLVVGVPDVCRDVDVTKSAARLNKHRVTALGDGPSIPNSPGPLLDPPPIQPAVAESVPEGICGLDGILDQTVPVPPATTTMTDASWIS